MVKKRVPEFHFTTQRGKNRRPQPKVSLFHSRKKLCEEARCLLDIILTGKKTTEEDQFLSEGMP